MFKLARSTRAIRPTGWLLLAWSNRHTVRLWFRSIQQVFQNGFDWKTLSIAVRSLIRVTSDPRLYNDAGLKVLHVVDNKVIMQADPSWKQRDVAQVLLQGVKGVAAVESLGNVIPLSAVSGPGHTGQLVAR